jgi:hypothetical protein
MKGFNNFIVGEKLTAGFLSVSLVILIVAFVGYFNTRTINAAMLSLYHEQTVPIQQLGTFETGLYKLQGDIYRYAILSDDRATTGISLQKDLAQVTQDIEAYRSSDLPSDKSVNRSRFSIRIGQYIKTILKTL